MATDQNPRLPENELAPEFVRLLASNPNCDVFEYLRACPRASSLDRLKVLLIDQRHRIATNRALPLRVYLKAFPDIAARGELIRPLIDEDRESRRRSAAQPIDPTTDAAKDLASRAATVRLSDVTTTTPDPSEGWTRPEHPTTGTTRLATRGETTAALESAATRERLSFALDEEYHLHSEAESLRAMLNSVRFTLVRKLGAGGMGVVYEAYDQERGELVALKTMRRADPSALVRFKQEFRSLCDVTHPNLVNLYELFAVEDRWFFTMELVEGCDFIRHIRGPGANRFRARDERREGADREHTAPERGFDEAKLRHALFQLALGVSALHQAGKLHRDVKPTNVLAADDGRIVLLDFGLTADLEETGRRGSSDRRIVGTIAAMSPEQAEGAAVTPASDWYSVGVMLFEALTGELPFQGAPEEILTAKRTRQAPRADTIVGGLPEDLVELCAALLDREASHRKGAREVIAVATGRLAPALDDDEPVEPARPIPIIGRTRHRRVLEDLYQGLQKGLTERLYVFGSTGTGKTTLIRSFLDEASARGAVVLSGRCYERETVPYKALDNLIDSLARYLNRLPPREALDLVPDSVGSLARLFPVLHGVEAVQRVRSAVAETPDRQELRRRASDALCELLKRIGKRARLVLTIDDLQWGDLDSALLLADLFSSASPPRLLFIGCLRSDDDAPGPFFLALEDAVAGSIGRRELAVEPLTSAESRELALALLGREDPIARAQAHMAARESRGNPLFIDELVKHVQLVDPTARWDDVKALDLDVVLWSRIQKQPEDALRLLTIVAVSGRPIRQMIAFEAARLGGGGRVALASLRSARLVRCLGQGPHGEIEIYHDRIRETTVAHLPAAELATAHERLALTLEGEVGVDPEVLAQHYRGAGDLKRACDYLIQAADQAAAALAFDRAARLYSTAIELEPTPAQAHGLRRKQADALANAGRASQAAAAYQQAARTADPETTRALHQFASAQLMISGQIGEGLAILRTLLEPLGEKTPGSPRAALFSLIRHRFLLRLRGLDYRRRSEDQVPPLELARVDLCWAAVTGLSMSEPIRGADFQTRGLLRALKAGEPCRIARALAMEAAHRSTAGDDDPQVDRLIAAARAAAGDPGPPYLQGLIAMASGAQALFQGRWKPAQQLLDDADRRFRDHCAGVAWERDTIHNFTLWALFQMGEISELKKRWTTLSRESRERGDLYAAAMLSSLYRTLVKLADNEPIDHESRLEATLAPSPGATFGLEHAAAFDALFHLDLYRGDAAQALDRVNSVWPQYEKSLLLRIRTLRIVMREQRGRAILAAAERAPLIASLLKTATDDAKALESEDQTWASAHAAYLRGGIAACREDAVAALAYLAKARELYLEAGMNLRAHVIGMRIGEIDPDASRTLRDASQQAVQNHGVVAPARWAGLFAPGFARISGDSIETSI